MSAPEGEEAGVEGRDHGLGAGGGPRPLRSSLVIPAASASSGAGGDLHQSQLRVRDFHLVSVPPLSSWVHVGIFDIFQLFRECCPALNLLRRYPALSTFTYQMKCSASDE